MTDRTLVAAVVGLVILAAMGPAAAAVTTTDTERQATPTDGSGDVSLGASVSGFMQASAADAEDEVDDGVFRARAANASDERQRALVAERADELDDRLERLRERQRTLLGKEGNLTVAERAEAARLAAEISSLQDAVETTDEVATEAGVDNAALDRLREDASELNGTEVAELAGEVADPPTPAERDSEGETRIETPAGGTPTPGGTDGDTTETGEEGTEDGNTTDDGGRNR